MKIYINAKTGGSFIQALVEHTNRSFDHDLECRDLHAFGNIVCNGEQRVQGKSIVWWNACRSKRCRQPWRNVSSCKFILMHQVLQHLLTSQTWWISHG